MSSRSVLAALSVGFVALALLALIAGDRPTDVLANVDLHSLAADIEQERDHLLPDSVRILLTSGTGLQVIDLRDSAAFALAHLPGAVRSNLEGLLVLPLRKDLPILLYSDGGTHAAQGWMLLRARGFPAVHSMLGGWKAWSAASGSTPASPALIPPKPRNESSERERLRGEC